MTHAQAMLETHPSSGGTMHVDTLAEVLHHLEECAQTCSLCADACLAEDMVAELRAAAFASTSTAPTCAGRPPQSWAARSSPTARPSVRSSRRAVPRAQPAGTSVAATPACTSTAGSVPRPASAASRPAPKPSSR